MSEQKKQCNCKGAKRIAQVSDYLKQYGEFEDQEQTSSIFWKKCLLNLITIISIPFLFMYICLNAVFNLIKSGTMKVSVNRIYKYIQDKHNNG